MEKTHKLGKFARVLMAHFCLWLQVTFDPAQVSFGQLLGVFFDQVDPTTLNRQKRDRGTQYRSAIFCHSLQQQVCVCVWGVII